MSAETGPNQRSFGTARSQLLFRRINEEIRSLGGDDELLVLCECVNDECAERLAVSASVYEDVRRFPTRFLVKHGHVAVSSERAVEFHDGVVVVEKVGADAERAIMLDPRRRENRRLRVVGSDADLPLTREVRA